jgi:hypothetical protein
MKHISNILPPYLHYNPHSIRHISLYIETSSMELRDTVHDREADTHTLIRSCTSLIYAVEFLFHKSKLRVWYPDAIIEELEYIFFLFLLISDGKSCIFSCIFDKVREDIVEDLYVHIPIHTRHGIGRKIEIDHLGFFLELGHILFYDILCRLAQSKSLHRHLVKYIMRE